LKPWAESYSPFGAPVVLVLALVLGLRSSQG
jgi:hypothetical protein